MKLPNLSANSVFITDIFLYYKYDEKDYREAILLYEEMITRTPNNLDAYMLLAFSKFRLGIRAEAFELYDKVLTMIDQESKNCSKCPYYSHCYKKNSKLPNFLFLNKSMNFYLPFMFRFFNI